MLWRRRNTQAQAAGQAEEGQGADAGIWQCVHPAGGVHRGAADGRRRLIGGKGATGGRHFAVIAPPTLGHLNPLIALARALCDLGHRCTFIHTADAGRFVAGGALGFAPLGDTASAGLLDEHLHLLADPTGPVGLRRMIRGAAAMTAILLDGVPAVARRIGADVVLADMAEPAGALLARHLGLPCVAAVTGLPLMEEPDVPPPFVDWPYIPGGVGRFRNQGGYAVARLLMRPVDRVIVARTRAWGLAEGGLAEVGSAPRLHVAQCPAAFDFPRTVLPPAFHYGAPWRLPEEGAVDLPNDGRPLVFCSLGTLQGSRTAVFASITAACAAAGARAVVAHGGGLSESEAAGLPGEPIVRAFWPQRAVLARCAAAVLHGGFNTVLDALTAGVPIVAVPIAFEQPATAARIEWTGAGRMVPFRRANPRALTAALRAVLGRPSYREAARRLQATMAGRDGAADAATAINESLRLAAMPAAATRALPD